jgi:uncharacterized protein with FMN-binding domain
MLPPGPVSSERLADGVFIGAARNGPNSAKVRVTVRDSRIVGIRILKHIRSWKGGSANVVIPQRIIEKQSTAVDAITGATNSSRVIMSAVQDAVRKSYAVGKAQREAEPGG